MTRAASPGAVASMPPHQPPFELLLRYRLCAVASGQVHCRADIDAASKLTGGPTLAGLEHVDVATASFGVDFGCVATRAGAVECFGTNQYGQLGAHVREARHDAPIELPNLGGVQRLVSGGVHTCAVLAGGQVSCWGPNWFGETGSDTTYLEAARELVEPRLVAGISDVADISLSAGATCAVTRGGQAFCWGKVKPDDLRGGRVTPVRMPTLDGISSLTANATAFCGIRRAEVVCWGDLMWLVPTDTPPENRVAPIGIQHARRVSLGDRHGCAVDETGAVYCFGTNEQGAVGIPGRYTTDGFPNRVPGVPPAVDIVAGGNASCAITAADEVYCWGGWSAGEAEPTLHAPERINL